MMGKRIERNGARGKAKVRVRVKVEAASSSSSSFSLSSTVASRRTHFLPTAHCPWKISSSAVTV